MKDHRRLRLRTIAVYATVSISAALAGCAANAAELVYQAADAAARTWIDQWLTDFVNQAADAAPE